MAGGVGSLGVVILGGSIFLMLWIGIKRGTVGVVLVIVSSYTMSMTNKEWA